MPTSEVKLPASYVDALHRVAPKRRRSKLWYLLGLVVVGASVSLAVSPSLRHGAVERARQIVSRSEAPAADAPSAAVSEPSSSAGGDTPPPPAPVVAAPSFVIPRAAPTIAPTAAGSAKPGKQRLPPRGFPH
jgi:hypothetical protein